MKKLRCYHIFYRSYKGKCGRYFEKKKKKKDMADHMKCFFLQVSVSILLQER